MRAYLPLCLLQIVAGCDRTPELLYPDHPMGLAAAALRDTAFTWQTRESDHFRIHFQPDSYAAEHIDQFVRDAEQARANGLRLLGETRFIPRIDVFHLKSRDQMKRITDFAVRGWADPAARAVLLVRSSAANQGERHEIAHVLSHTLWGHSLDWLTTGWMSEALRPLDSLARKFRSYNDLVAYLQAGSFFGYVLNKYELPRVRALWQQGFERFETIFEITPAAADAEWRKHLKTLYPDARVDWPPLKKVGCQ
jgi:hypothetical protein